MALTEYTQEEKRFRQRKNKNEEQKLTHKPVYTNNTSVGYITTFP